MDFANGYVQIHSVTIETEHEASLHSEVSSQTQAQNLIASCLMSKTRKSQEDIAIISSASLI